LTASALDRRIADDSTPLRSAATDVERRLAAIVASAEVVPIVCDGTGKFDDFDEYRRTWPCRGCRACQPKEKETA
jgi:hypothetical protein